MIRPITAAETRPLRHRVLRPNQAPDELVYPGDDALDTIHFGAFAGEVIVAIASLYREPLPDRPDPHAWRLRGMATTPEVRGGGYGGHMLEACIEHARGQGGKLLWCNARTEVTGFYARYGFGVTSPVFEIDGVGPHVIMEKVTT